MLATDDRRPAPLRRTPGGPAGHLRAALLALGGGHGEVVRHAEKPWASITFEGARHRFELRFAGAEGVDAGETLIEALAEHEFAVPGQLVAEARVTEVDQRLAPDPALTVTCELLLLKDA